MFLSINWLKEFTPYTGSLDELAHQLTMLGLEVEEVLNPFAHLEPFLVGHVLDCSLHPNADSLSCCQVDVGGENPLAVVCGAPNVAAGQKVAVAPVGPTLPGGLKIKKAKIRGALSQGMICSEKELELSEDHSGIMVLDTESTPGTPLLQALNLDTVVLDIGITPNRADCLSILGLAREVAAVFDLPLHLPETRLQEEEQSCASRVQIQIDAPELCPLYQARIIDDLSIRPSPPWLRYRLLSMGLRPINNVVDVTNYVMFELGQPLHAFDHDLLEGGLIRVGTAQAGQRFTTLDNQERSLSPRDLLIQDGVKPVALAGVMGGANSEITAQSTNLLLESAVFDPGNTRRTGRSLGISSESAYRFERGVDQPGSAFALDRAAGLIQSLAGGRLLKGRAASEPRPWSPRTVSFRPKRAQSLLALSTDAAASQKVLENIGCDIQPSENGALRVTPPSYRLDLEREVDLIEEIGRFHGFERIEAALPRIRKSPLQDDARSSGAGLASHEFLNRTKTWAQGRGYHETVNYSFCSRQELEALRLADELTIPVHNPLSAEQDSMRPALMPGLLRNVRTNLDQGNQDLRFFEIARIFQHDPRSETTAREANRLGLLCHGRRNPPFWPWSGEAVGYLDLKGVLEHFFLSLGLEAALFTPGDVHGSCDPGIRIVLRGEDIGFLGRLQPGLAKDLYHARTPIWISEIDVDALHRFSRGQPVIYRSWAKFPPVQRDLTLICPLDVSYAQILEVIAAARIPTQESVSLKDVYQPDQSLERNLTLRITYRHQKKTMTDKEVDKQHFELGERICKALPVRFPG
ncbi:MAG: phenylalanine--tRNA ligase subunit beta [Desulfohalobiaceae bacterium]|nr:phenylalanine--tRNA ligase subunit beta [Desulfohalobiaceae bacterium]